MIFKDWFERFEDELRARGYKGSIYIHIDLLRKYFDKGKPYLEAVNEFLGLFDN